MLQVISNVVAEDEDLGRAAAYYGDGRDERGLHRLALAFAQTRAVEREACARTAEKVRPIEMANTETKRTWGEANPVSMACARAIRQRGAHEDATGLASDGEVKP